jgi:hypothetical protein
LLVELALLLPVPLELVSLLPELVLGELLLEDELGELLLDEELGELVLEEELLSLLLPVELLPEEPVWPADMMSSFFTLSVSPEPEKLARTWSPSLMSSREARLPSFCTFVVESSFRVLSLPESVSVLFERSKLWTRPWSESKWPLDEEPVEAIEPLESDDLSLLLPVLGELELLLELGEAELLLEPVPLDAVESRELPVDEPLWPIVLEVSVPLDELPPIVPLLESRLEPVEPLVLPPL